MPQIPPAGLGHCHPAPQLVRMQERCRTHVDGMEILLPGVPARPQCCCPAAASRRIVRVRSGTRNPHAACGFAPRAPASGSMKTNIGSALLSLPTAPHPVHAFSGQIRTETWVKCHGHIRRLYYPFIHFRDEGWLKLTALYWDGMRRIVPVGANV